MNRDEDACCLCPSTRRSAAWRIGRVVGLLDHFVHGAEGLHGEHGAEVLPPAASVLHNFVVQPAMIDACAPCKPRTDLKLQFDHVSSVSSDRIAHDMDAAPQGGKIDLTSCSRTIGPQRATTGVEHLYVADSPSEMNCPVAHCISILHSEVVPYCQYHLLNGDTT